MIENLNAFSGLIIGALSFSALSYAVILQGIELYKRPKDGLEVLRWQIFLVLFIAIVGSIPSLMYIYFRSRGIEAGFLRNVATITGRLGGFANAILIVMIFRFKKKGD